MTMIPPRVRIPRSDTPRDRYGAVAVSLLFHAIIIAILLWKGVPVASDFLSGELGGGGGGNNGDESTLISLAGPPEPPPVQVETPPVTPPDPVPTPTPTPVPPPPKDTAKTPPAPAPAPAPTTDPANGGSGANGGAGSAGTGGGAGGGNGTGVGPGSGAGVGPGSGGGTGGGGNSDDGLIPPSPSTILMPPPAPKGVKGKSITVFVTIDATGKVLDAELKESSGNSKYDKDLEKRALGWRFRPARTRDGQSVKSVFTFSFTI